MCVRAHSCCLWLACAGQALVKRRRDELILLADIARESGLTRWSRIVLINVCWQDAPARAMRFQTTCQSNLDDCVWLQLCPADDVQFVCTSRLELLSPLSCWLPLLFPGSKADRWATSTGHDKLCTAASALSSILERKAKGSDNECCCCKGVVHRALMQTRTRTLSTDR